MAIGPHAGNLSQTLSRFRRTKIRSGTRFHPARAKFISGTRNSDYIHEPPFFKDFSMEAGANSGNPRRAPLGIFGDSVTTDHISPAGAIKADLARGQYLVSRGIKPEDFNSYGSRRGNDLVMTRGTFANVRIKNLMVPGIEGGVTNISHISGCRRDRCRFLMRP